MLKHLLILIVLLLSVEQAVAFESELWPEEGRPVFTAKSDRLILYENPSKKSHAIQNHGIKKGEKIAFDETRYINIKAGIVEVKKQTDLSGNSYGIISYFTRSKYYAASPTKKYSFSEGSIISYIQYRAEGSCLININNEIIALDYCPWLDSEEKNFNMKSEPINEWWIRVVKNRKPIGWLLIENAFVQEDRSF